jgi:S1-C subfamily serine protease
MLKGTYTFLDKDKGPISPRMKGARKFSCSLVVIILISSLIFGFLGGVIAIYSLTGGKSLKETKLGQLIEKKEVVKVEEESATIEAVKKVSPAVVSITATQKAKNQTRNQNYYH